MANPSGNGPIAPLPSNRASASMNRSMSTQPLGSPHHASPFSPTSFGANAKDAFPIARARRGTPAPLARTMSSQSLGSTSFGSASPTTSSSLASSLTSVSSLSDATTTPATAGPKGAGLASFMGMLSNAHGLPSPKRRLTHARDDSFGASELEREQLRLMQEQIAQRRHGHAGADKPVVDASSRRRASGDASSKSATADRGIFTSPPFPSSRTSATRNGTGTKIMDKDMMATPPPQVGSSRPGMKRQCTVPLVSQSSASSVHSMQNADWTGSASDLSTPGLSSLDQSRDALLEGTPGDLVLDDDRENNSSPASSEIVTPERPFRLGSSIVAAAIGGQMTKKNDIPGPVLMANLSQPNIFQHAQNVDHVPSAFAAAHGQMTPAQLPMAIPMSGGVQPMQFAPAGVILTSPPSAGSVGTSVGSPMKLRPGEKTDDVWPQDLQNAFDAGTSCSPEPL